MAVWHLESFYKNKIRHATCSTGDIKWHSWGSKILISFEHGPLASTNASLNSLKHRATFLGSLNTQSDDISWSLSRILLTRSLHSALLSELSSWDKSCGLNFHSYSLTLIAAHYHLNLLYCNVKKYKYHRKTYSQFKDKKKI